MEDPKDQSWANVVNVEVDDDERYGDCSGVVQQRHYEATDGSKSPRSQTSRRSRTSSMSTRRPAALQKIQQQSRAKPGVHSDGWNLMADMSTGLGEYLYGNQKAPPMSNAGVRFRENPRKWLRGLNLRSTRMAFGVYMESHTVQLLMVILIIIDVCAVFGEVLLSQVCDKSRDVRACVPNILRIRLFYALLLSAFRLSLQEVHDTEVILHIISVTALSIFMFQQIILIAAYGTQFFKKPLYVIDFVIVAGALILELAVDNPSGRLIVVLMLWRGARVIHGFAVTIETEEEQIHRAEENVDKLRELLTALLGYEITMFRVHNMKQAARIIQHAYLRYFVSKKENENRVILNLGAKKTDDEEEDSKTSYAQAKELLDQLSDKDASRVKRNLRLIEQAKQQLGRMKYSLPLFNIHLALQEQDIDIPGEYGDQEDEGPLERRGSVDSNFSRSSALRSTSMLDLIMHTIQEETVNGRESESFRGGSRTRHRSGSGTGKA